ncbi:uncharacterized protein LOC132701271 isoform X2 [Cylas formicarius]|uniref:uncharacterized protein LOC132701271 isoform X2 n=1 Tax=Cylas formicarius TaxID=197179 RepID=UPI002958D0ED|nr:uncharacterized protein LOC132701271 isoform X2 [Cylas formicarius]
MKSSALAVILVSFIASTTIAFGCAYESNPDYFNCTEVGHFPNLNDPTCTTYFCCSERDDQFIKELKTVHAEKRRRRSRPTASSTAAPSSPAPSRDVSPIPPIPIARATSPVTPLKAGRFINRLILVLTVLFLIALGALAGVLS